jgi:tetratricopeptide (TPR) repeat protein
LSVQTYAGPAEASVTAIRPSPSITILFLLDTLSATENADVRKQLLDFYASFHGHPLQIAVLAKNGQFAPPVPVSSRIRFKQLLDSVASVEDPATVPSPAVLDDLLAVIPKMGAKESTLLMVGEFPKLDSASSAYASALLVKTLGDQQLRASLFSPAAIDPDWTALFQSRGGQTVTALNDLVLTPATPADSLAEISWTTPVPAAGFVVSHSAIVDDHGASVLAVPDISLAEGVSTSSIAQYVDAQKKIADAEVLLSEGPLTQARTDRMRESIQAALQLNSRDPGALNLATAMYEKAGDYADAAKFSALLLDVGPRDGTAYATFGHALRLNSELDRAEKALKRAAELGVTTSQLNEDFAQLLIARKDDKGALPYLQEVLKQDSKRQEIWFLQAEAAERSEDPTLAEHSYEQGLSLGGVHVPETAALLRLYIGRKQNEQAIQLAKAQLASLPPTPEDRLQFAVALDDLHQNDLAMQAWRALLDVQPASEEGHTRVARLLLQSGNASGAEQEADAGLSALPNSALLHLVKADAEEHEGRVYQARITLQEGASATKDLPLAIQLATTEEQFFGGAAAAYARLAELSPPSSPEHLRALEHGFDVAMRDGDLQQAEKFVASLEASGEKGYRSLLGEQKSNTSFVMVPGGLSGLAFAAHASKEEIPPERFFLEYCRTLVDGGVNTGKNQYLEGIREYFEHIAALTALGTNTNGDAVITLSLTDKSARHQTEKALNVLGIRLKSSKGEVELAQGEKKSQAAKQETAAALALDEVGIQEALQAGKPYRLVIHSEPASVYPSEQIWREGLGLKSYGPGGFAEELTRVPHLANVYLSLNSMDRSAADELLKAVSLKELCEHDWDLLPDYAPAFALEGTHAAVPGGAKAEPIWTHLVGVSPSTPGPFFRALLKHDDGKLLVYFAILAQLDRPHQSFFTATEGRAKQFYELLTSTRQMHTRPYAAFQDAGFQRMLRSVPLDEEGHIEFPGSPEVWTVAKGRSSDEGHTAHLMKKVRKAATPEVEDAVLVRLAGTQYKENNAKVSELDNFLAVSSIDAHRKEPMDEESALLLAQKYADYAATYPYLTDLRGLTASDYREFFSAFEHISGHPALEANLQLGQLHALTEWICLLVQRHAIKDEQAAELIRKMVSAFAATEDAASYPSASLDSIRAILQACRPGEPPDEAMRSCLLGHHAAADDDRMKHFMRILDAQHVPSLNTLLEIHDASANLASPKAPAAVDTIAKAVDTLAPVELPKAEKIPGEEKNSILRYDSAPARKIVAQLKEKTSKRKVNPKDLQKLAHELEGELQGQVTAALSGPLYAYFLRSTDAIVINDPLLLRKHHYFQFNTPSAKHEEVISSDFAVSSETIGSYFIGGFAQFAYSAGLAAAYSKNLGGSKETMAAQLASIRSADWERLDESDQRLAALRVIVAREWIYESARQPDVYRALSESTMGLLSLSRRAQLLNGISSRDWPRAWNSITLPELFALGARYPKQFHTDPWPSEATPALRAAEKTHDDGRLNVLGPIPSHIFGCNHPHLLSDAPYEEYERHLPSEMAERSAEFNLFLVFQGDRLGLGPESLEKVDEPLAVKAFRKAQMTDYRDWRALMNAYSSVTPADLTQAIRHE